MGGVAEQQERDVSRVGVAVGPDLADIERIVTIADRHERHDRGAVPEGEGDGRHVLGLQRVRQLGVAEVHRLGCLRAFLA